MNIAGYISKLLYHHDCVIIPGFGGLVADYAPAKIHQTTHTFSPPTKSILFNSQLNTDDGILMHFVAKHEKISYAEAKMEINYFVQALRLEIEEGKEVVLEKIGSFSKNVNSAFSFSPDKTVNYLEASFGLPTFISPPIARKSISKRLEKKFIDRKPKPDSDRKDRKVYWAYAAIIPIVLIVGWFIFMNSYDNKNAQQTGVINLADTDIEIPLETTNREDAEKPSQSLKDLNFSDNETITSDVSSNAINELAPTAEFRTELPKYYIIGGAFQFKDNADKLVITLRESGYNATHEGINPNGLYLISYFNSEDKSEALANLAMIRRESNPSAWLLKK